MSAKYTAGPWTHEGQGDIKGIENDPENGCVGPVDVACVYLRTVPGRHEANARLIAAAPDLLEALKELLNGADIAVNCKAVGPHWWHHGRKKARDAIAKAEGSAP